MAEIARVAQARLTVPPAPVVVLALDRPLILLAKKVT